MITQVIRDIFKVNLGVKRSETVLIFNDRISEKEAVDPSQIERREKLRFLSLLAAETGRPLCKSVRYLEYPATGNHGVEPPESLWELAFGKKVISALKKKGLLQPILEKKADDTAITAARDILVRWNEDAVDCVIALSNYSTSHTRFRDLLTGVCGARYASMPLFDITMMDGAMNVDWKDLSRRTLNLAKIVATAESIEITSPNGTEISFSKKGRATHADTGILTKKGSFGNLPAGEVYLAPLEGTAEGKMVLEWAPMRQLRQPVVLQVKKGSVIKVTGREEFAGILRKRLEERKENANIAELGIGTNEAARRPDNILESEKILGTIHIALGDNSSFGGKVKTPYHQDFVFFKPTVTLISKDGGRREILKAGKLLSELRAKSSRVTYEDQ